MAARPPGVANITAWSLQHSCWHPLWSNQFRRNSKQFCPQKCFPFSRQETIRLPLLAPVEGRLPMPCSFLTSFKPLCFRSKTSRYWRADLFILSQSFWKFIIENSICSWPSSPHQLSCWVLVHPLATYTSKFGINCWRWSSRTPWQPLPKRWRLLPSVLLMNCFAKQWSLIIVNACLRGGLWCDVVGMQRNLTSADEPEFMYIMQWFVLKCAVLPIRAHIAQKGATTCCPGRDNSRKSGRRKGFSRQMHLQKV